MNDVLSDERADELVKWKAFLPHRVIVEQTIDEQITRLQNDVNQANKQPGLDSSISCQARMFAIAQLKSLKGLFDFYDGEIKKYLN